MRFPRTKQDIFLEDGTGLWDSDEADDLLRNQMEKLNNLKYDDESASEYFHLKMRKYVQGF